MRKVRLDSLRSRWEANSITASDNYALQKIQTSSATPIARFTELLTSSLCKAATSLKVTAPEVQVCMEEILQTKT